MADIVVKEVSIDEVVRASAKVPEFQPPLTVDDFSSRVEGKDNVFIAAYVDNVVAGYIVGYNRDDDGSFYCWMAGVGSDYRRLGLLKSMMEYEDEWAKERGYSTLRIKTRNNRREMLGYLVKHGFDFVEVDQREEISENRIVLERKL